MKILTLLRHAKSTWDDPVARDFDRPLNRRGRRAAHAIGAEMRRLGLAFDRVIASPATRVKETLDEVEAGYARSLGAAFDQRVYLAGTDALLDIVRSADDKAGRLLVVGHNPGLESLAIALTRGGGLRDEVAIKYPTGTLAEISLPAERWREIVPGSGRLTRFIRPRDLDPELGPDEDTY
ncbi:MAG TPA: histidine phosphatase family protein [Allosphingosinicella sp.]|nr:histidine phosphatase family protein [Allosphingosinicella sp.]